MRRKTDRQTDIHTHTHRERERERERERDARDQYTFCVVCDTRKCNKNEATVVVYVVFWLAFRYISEITLLKAG